MRSKLRSRLDETVRESSAMRARLDIAARTETVLRELVAILPVGVVVVDPESSEAVENGRLTAPTPDPSINVLIRKAALELAADCQRTGEPLQRQIELHGPPAYIFDLGAHPLSSGAVACLVEDVSERRRLATVRRDFTVNASHELRTPIGAIGLPAETLEAETAAATVRRLAARIVQEAERARLLLEGILDLSRVEADGSTGASEVDLAQVAEEAATRLAALAERAGVTIVVEAAGPVGVAGSGEQLISAVSNLLDNAVKYSPGGGTVAVRVASADGWADVSVCDHGVGIPARDLDRIFERFYRVDRGRARRTGGTGLGLAIVRHIAENHGGEVIVVSREGEGSTFTLRLPVAS